MDDRDTDDTNDEDVLHKDAIKENIEGMGLFI
jgi:hypothetical protein